MNQEDSIKLKDLQHKAFKLQREVMKINKERKAITNDLFKVHHQINCIKKGEKLCQKKDGMEGKKI